LVKERKEKNKSFLIAIFVARKTIHTMDRFARNFRPFKDGFKMAKR